MSESRLLREFVEKPWAILPAKLETLAEIVTRHVNGEKLDANEVQSRIHGASRPPDRRIQNVAILPLFGTIFPRANLMTEMSGATSAQIFGAEFSKLLDDPSVDAIILDVDSPGGQVGGIEEVSRLVYDARGRKPVVAVANYLMASAAYWIGSAAEELVVSPSGEVGSIGVFAVHQDISGALEKDGVKISIISEGKYKTAGNPYEPLGEEARAVIQASVHDTYKTFIDAVARNRGVDVDVVQNGFGEGALVGAPRAVEMGMADRVATLEETVNRLLGGVPAAKGRKASSEEEMEQSDSTDDGQEPVADVRPTQEARARLARVMGQIEIEGDSIMLRRLLREREEKMARAQELVDTADAEERDLNETERAEFAQLLGEGEGGGEIAALDAKIEQVHGERERLRAAAEKKFGVKPEAQKPDESQDAKRMKRAEFDELDVDAQAAYIKGGGRVQD